MVRLWRSHNKFYQPLLNEVLDLLDDASVVHAYREANRCVDLLANDGHSGPIGWKVFDRASPILALLLREDALGCSIPRFFA